jgi:hypothetical protein
MEGNTTNNNAWTLERHLIVAISMMARNLAANSSRGIGARPEVRKTTSWVMSWSCGVRSPGGGGFAPGVDEGADLLVVLFGGLPAHFFVSF